VHFVEPEQLFDVTLKVKQPQELKEFNFADRSAKDVQMLLKRIREDIV
jgi:hypothetical protein